MQRDKLERDDRCGGWKIGDIYKHLELNTAIETVLQALDNSIPKEKGKRKGEAEEEQKGFWFATDFPVSRKNVANLVQRGRMRWKIENEGFNTQKKQGYYLEHQYSKDYQAMKNHYYLTQIGHMVAQVMEAWEKLWSQNRQSREQRHRRVLESFKKVRLKENREETGRRIQIRLEPE